MMRRIAVIVLLCGCGALGYDWLTMARHSGPVSAHFDGQRFVSPGYARKKPLDVLRWGLQRDTGPWQMRGLPAVTPPQERVQDDLRVTLVNHSTVLIQFAGFNLLTDPIWSEHTGPFGKIGPERFRPPGVAMADLPPIDAVLISHSHYDHMDLPTLDTLRERFDPVFIVGLGNRDNLAKVDINRVVELDWWESHTLGQGVEILAAPAAHWSKRTALDTNRTLWLSFVIRHDNQHRVYYAGDSGYGPHFEAVRQRAGAPQIALLPIGAYLPRWFMQDNHISPPEALAVAAELQASIMIPVHFGTFALGDDGQDEPLQDLLAAMTPTGSPTVRVLDNGQAFTWPHGPVVANDESALHHPELPLARLQPAARIAQRCYVQANRDLGPVFIQTPQHRTQSCF